MKKYIGTGIAMLFIVAVLIYAQDIAEVMVKHGVNTTLQNTQVSITESTEKINELKVKCLQSSGKLEFSTGTWTCLPKKY